MLNSYKPLNNSLGTFDPNAVQARLALFTENSQFDSVEAFLRRTLDRFSGLEKHNADWINNEIFCSMRSQGRLAEALRFVGQNQSSFLDPKSGVGLVAALCDAGLWQEAEALFADYRMDAPAIDGSTNDLDLEAMTSLLKLKLELVKLYAALSDWSSVQNIALKSLSMDSSSDEFFSYLLKAKAKLGEPLVELCRDAESFLDQFPNSLESVITIINLCALASNHPSTKHFVNRLKKVDLQSSPKEKAAVARVWIRAFQE